MSEDQHMPTPSGNQSFHLPPSIKPNWGKILVTIQKTTGKARERASPGH